MGRRLTPPSTVPHILFLAADVGKVAEFSVFVCQWCFDLRGEVVVTRVNSKLGVLLLLVVQFGSLTDRNG
ncbi:hypothetical protein Droror1_Dr00009790 [Drosera rotundifolia]